MTDLPERLLAERLGQIVNQPDENSVMSTADRLRAEGRAQGKVEGRVELLLRQLTARFGPLPDHILARLRNPSPEDLERWALGILEARCLTDVFGAE